jgi:hypothetical protein
LQRLSEKSYGVLSIDEAKALECHAVKVVTLIVAAVWRKISHQLMCRRSS